MNIVWFVSGLVHAHGAVSSGKASTRLRCLQPLAGIRELHQHLRARLCDPRDGDRFDRSWLDDTDLILFGKIPSGSSLPRGLLEQRHIPVLVDVCDDPFCRPEMRALYRKLMPQADRIVAASHHLAGKITAAVDCPVQVIGDHGEYPGQALAYPTRPGAGLSLCWYGDPLNIDALFTQLNGLKGLPFTCITIHVVTRFSAEVRHKITRAEAGLAGRIRLIATEWSPQHLVEAVALSHIAIIPVAGQEWALSKTANRLMTAIQLNRPCVAGCIPSYREFARFAHLGSQLSSGILAIVAEWEAWPERLAAGRQFIDAHYSGRHIARQWLQAIEATMAAPSLRQEGK